MQQLKISPTVNKNLFSKHFIDEILPKHVDEWKEDKKIRDVYKKITSIYENEKDQLEKYNEYQLEDHFIKPIFEELGHCIEVQERDRKGKRPDYAFFQDADHRRSAIDKKEEKQLFYATAIAVGDAKEWAKPLDKKAIKGTSFEDQNPSFQIDTYLRNTDKNWGVLTNGECWRIYYRKTSYQLDSYFEINLADIIVKKDIELFKYFYFFFRKEAFVPDSVGKTFLDYAYEESINFAKTLGEGLKENVYKALKILAEGFFAHKENELEKNPNTLGEIHDNSLVFLYRLLFVLYAESRGLLDIFNQTYNKTFSLNSLKRTISEDLDNNNELYAWRKEYWSKLQRLFSLINEGSETHGIPREDLYIPPYNGGLFNDDKHLFLKDYAVGDNYLAKVIDLLSRSNGDHPGFIDYSTLDIRHLGSIYEGLLEYKIRIAEEDMVSVKKKGKEIWITQSDFKKGKIYDQCKQGELCLSTDKGERKATGSYYTPGYIVKYIVENTVAPLVESNIKEAKKNKQRLSDAILSVTVLDPAMGSGHFLVETVDFLSGPLLDAVNEDISNGLLPEGEYSTEWAKREIVSHCIYGVDLNYLAVELAKLSLWLKTIAKDKPLSFLDHRLKCGNSLIGTTLEDLPWHPSKKIKTTQMRFDIPAGFIKKLVDTVHSITEIGDDTLKEIRTKERIFGELKQTMEYDMIKVLADVRASIYFENDLDQKLYGSFTGDAFWSSKDEWKSRRKKGFVKKAEEIANIKHFFHWELEFPEIFFENGKLKKNPGFDVVIGNPPYGAEFDRCDREYISDNYQNSKNNKNSAMVFIDAAFDWMHTNSIFGMIVPKSLTFSQKWKTGRNLVLPGLISLVDASKAFEDVLLEQVVVIFSKKKSDLNNYHTSFFINEEVAFPVNIERNLCDITDTLLISIDKCEIEIFRKMLLSNLFLGEISKTSRGLPCQKHISDDGKIKVYRGDHISRYNLTESNEYVGEEVVKRSSNKVDFIRQPKVISQRIIAHVLRPVDHILLMATWDKEGILNVDTVENTIITDKNYSEGFVTVLLNSSLISWYAYRFIFNKAIRTMDFDNYYVSKIPTCCIRFTTPLEQRTALLGEGKQLYEKYLKNEDFTPISDFIEMRMPKDKNEDFIIEKQENDVIHDFLSYLSEQIIDMNTCRNKEIGNFLSWIEREIGTKIAELTNKSKLENYYSLEFDEFLGILKKNKEKISAYLPNRELQENLKREFEKSLSVMLPVNSKINATDCLIDKIVYKLYGLKDGDITSIEENLRS